MRGFTLPAVLAFLLVLPGPAPAAVTVPADSPFSYGAGCTYDSWNQSWTAYSTADTIRYVSQDLDKITQYFSMIHTYHAAAVGTSQLTIDPGLLGVLTYAKDHPEKGLQVLLGTNQDEATSAKLGSLTYARQWVQTILLDPMGNNKSLILGTVKAIGIGNEIDAQSVFSVNDFEKAVNNLYTALNEVGLGGIPITTTIANITSNSVARQYVDALASKWQSSWGDRFLFVNNFPWMQGKGVAELQRWYAEAETQYSSWSLFIGETGYPTRSDTSCWFDQINHFPNVSGGTGETAYANDLFTWLGNLYNSNDHHTITTFVFGAFDEPKKDPNCANCSENHYGLLNAQGLPKTDSAGHSINIPGWVKHEN